MGKGQRTKGHDGEREAAALIREHGMEAERILTQVRDGGGDLDTTFGQVEVKRRSRGFKTLYRWLGDENRCLMIRDDRCPWLVVMPAQDALRLLRLEDEIRRKVAGP